ncbi:hypothetical protein F2P81_004583 [Scophthalmus maximus]|uniref:Stereocilin LRR domain-containing protein n=1 Tax=Scophthalmus maximus TaxID=52904 RepID=A0A6A4T6M8_SCOMX|nr:hypothetical protein F2P81_004583 [Scophthalmus maximus]
MGAELEEAPAEPDEQQLWEKVLHFLLQSEGSTALNQWNGQVPPRPSVKLQDWFLSLRGSPHWDWLLGLLQSLLSLSERQPHRPLLAFLSQNWRTVSAVLEAALQALVSGTYGQASAGLQGFICALKGRNDCAFSVSWLQQVLRFLETRNWKPVVSLHPAGGEAEHNKGSGAFGRLKPFSMPPEAMRQDGLSGNASTEDKRATEEDPDSMQSFLLQALSRSGGGERGGQNVALVQGLDGLRRGLLHRVGSSVYGNLRRKVSRVTMALLDDVSTLVDVPQPSAQSRCSVVSKHNRLHELSTAPRHSQVNQSKTGNAREMSSEQRKETEYPTSTEILEAACNESIPGLTGVSNFTVFLYCKLFDGENGAIDPAVAQMGLDLHATCSDAAWYLSAAEDDFLWVHVCSEFFAHEFNNTVCANSSFWLQKAHQAAVTKDYHFFNQTSIDELCVQLSGGAIGSPELDESCLAQLGSRSLSAQAFRHCFLPNNSVLIAALCDRESPDSQPSLPDASWAAAYCSKVLNLSHADAIEESCQYREWAAHRFTNTTLLELCGQTPGLREYMCLNTSLYNQLLRSVPQFDDFCADLEAELEGRKCFLQRFFDMLPAPYEFDTSQLCVDPAPLLVDIFHKLSVCEVEGGEREGFLVALGYVLRVLDFMVGLSSGLDEGEGEARKGLGQAILLSSLLDNTSWTALRPEASTSVLRTVGVFLRREQNTTLKEDLLSCFSPVLWDLIRWDDNSSALRVLLQEYLQMPRDSIRTLVMSAEKDAVKRFLSHMHQSWEELQVETSQASQKELQAMETMTAAFIHKFPRVTPELFVDLSQFIPFMSVSDIMSFPASLIINDTVLTAIRDHSSGMKSLQKKAFVKRLLQSSVVGDVPSWPPYFLSSILPLLPYLPVSHFQLLTSQQLAPLVELLGNGSLDGVRGRHVLRTLFSKKKNLTSEQILRLGVLACYLDPAVLGSYVQDSAVSSALWQQLAQCMSKGFVCASGRLSSWLIPALQALNVSSMSPQELSALSGLLPQLGASFLLSLPSQQLLEVLSQPGIHKYSPAQAFQLLSKISEDTNLTMERLCRLKPLLSGLSPAVLRNLQWPEISQTAHCQCWRTLLTELKPGHRAMLYSAIQEALHRDLLNFTQQVNCLLPFVPLRKLMEATDGETVPRHISLYRDVHWSPQQAQFLFKKAYDFENITFKSVRVTMIENLSNASFKAILDNINANFADFLRMPHYKQMNLAEKAKAELGSSQAEEEIDGTTLDALGPLLPFLDRDSLALVNSGALTLRLEEMRSFCLPKEALRDISSLLTQKDLLGRMSQEDLKQCVEVLGQDASLSSEQRRSLWMKLKQSFSAVRELRADQVLSLGFMVTEMGERELQDTDLTEAGVLAHLGTLTGWSPKKMRAVVLGVMRRRKLKVEQLTVVDVATFGHLICGLYPSEIKRLTPYILSVAALFLREMSLPCTEQQMEALASRLSRPEAFGPVSAWGPEVFTEIGTLAVGLQDMALSALVQEQVEGITPEAIALMSPEKMAVVFSAVQLSWLSAEQAWAVTEEQWTELDTEQRHAVGLARFEGDALLELRAEYHDEYQKQQIHSESIISDS